MKRTKRIIALFLSVVLAFSILCSTPAFAEQTFIVNGVEVSPSSGTSLNNCAAYASEVLKKIWNGYGGKTVVTTTFNSSYNMLKGKSASDRALTAEHTKEFIQAAPLGSRIRICHSDNETDNNYDNNKYGHTLVLVAKDDGAESFTTLEAGSGIAHARTYTYQGFVDKWGSYTKNGVVGYNYFFYIADLSCFASSSTPPSTSAPSPSPSTVTQYFECDVQINCIEGQIVNLYNNPGDTTRVTYFSKGQSPRSVYKAQMGDGSTWYKVNAYHQGSSRDFWLRYETGKMTVTDLHTTHIKGDYQGYMSEHPHYKCYKCAVCGDTFQDTTEPTTDPSCQQCHPEHVWDGGAVTAEPTITTTGVITYTCIVCGEKKTETIPKLVEKCASGHTWNSGVVTVKPSHSSTGIKKYTCTVCGNVKTEEIPKLITDSGLNNFVPVNMYSSKTFRDVASNAWYSDNVSMVYQLGLMNGTGANVFSPGNNITIAETITLAARLHNIYYTGEEKIATYDGGNWYDPYVNYARDNGIISENYNFAQPATREQFVHILAQSLPDEALEAIKEEIRFADSGSMIYAGDVQLLSRAGVIVGTESGGVLYFKPQNNISRAEAAAVITRMAKIELRIG